MNERGKKTLCLGGVFIGVFIVWTVLVQKVDVQPIGVNETSVGFAKVNGWFHNLTGVHMEIYTITDWLGLVPIGVCLLFGGVGIIQLFQRKSIIKVDYDIICLGIYYIMVVLGYLVFEMIPINYRPILINGYLETSYPSSTTLLVLCVMPTLIEQFNCRMKNVILKRTIQVIAVGFSVIMVFGRLISGVHWLTDIVGSFMLSTGLYCIYKATILLCNKEKTK